MRYSLLTSLILFLLLGTSCRKKDSNQLSGPGNGTGNGTGTSPLLDSLTARAVSDSTTFYGYKFRYDGNNNLVQYITNNERGVQFRYDAQNRLTGVSTYRRTSPNTFAGDTLIYSANGRTVRSHHIVSGTISPVPSRTYVFDNNDRLILDSIYIPPYIGVARLYLKYNYNTANDIQSTVLYSLDLNSPTRYFQADSLARTYDTHDNPFNKCSFANYNINFNNYTQSSAFGPVIYDFDISLPLSKHNLISSMSFGRASTQPFNTTSYSSTYSNTGIISSQLIGYGYNGNYDMKIEYWYR